MSAMQVNFSWQTDGAGGLVGMLRVKDMATSHELHV